MAIIHFIPARFMFALLSMMGFGIIYGLKVNLSIAIVRMVKSEEGGVERSVYDAGLMETESSEPTFDWDAKLRGLLLGSYFWGYIVSEYPGGRMAEKVSAKWVMFAAVAINAVGTLLTPLAANVHIDFLIALRILEGAGGGLTFPAMHVLIANWAPLRDRSLITSIVYAGTAFGTVLSFLLSGFIADALGWPFVFYIQGAITFIWLLIWAIYIEDTPEAHKFISKEEKEYITSSLGHHGHPDVDPDIPWKSVFTSLHFIAILFSHFVGNIGWYMLLLLLPGYMKTILHFELKENAVLCAVPFLCLWIFSNLLGKVCDILESKGILHHTTVRKIGTGIVAIGGGAFLVGVGYCNTNKDVAVALMTLSVTCYGAMFVGYIANIIDLASNYAGTLMAISNTLATVPGIVMPVIVGSLLEGCENEQCAVNVWRWVFWAVGALNVLMFINYLIFGTGKEQKWNKPPDAQHED